MSLANIADEDALNALSFTQPDTRFLPAVYAWMCGGLAITAAVAWIFAGAVAFLGPMATDSVLLWGLVAAQLVIVFVLSARADRIAPWAAALLFIFYAALNGSTLSFILLAFTGESVATAFMVTAGMFGVMALYGAVTRRNFTGAGSLLFMGLTGIVIASVVSLWWPSDALQFVISAVGVLVFTGLAAYDAQRLRTMAERVPPDRRGACAIVGALALYLDFINLFLSLLRFVGRRRD